MEKYDTQKYDAIVIGAGMSGLAAGIRLAMFDKKVCVLERHSVPGGLNSYYQRRVKETKEVARLDTGLHAMTNFASKGERRKPLTKLLKQLRIPYESLRLREQSHSLIDFPETKLRFSNDFELLLNEVAEKFPASADKFVRLVGMVKEHNELDLKQTGFVSARAVLKKTLGEPLLEEMLIAPLLIYGSAWENDMDFGQFVVMFKSIYMEGFSRPEGGVRTLIDLLRNRLKEEGGELKFRQGVSRIMVENGKARGVVTDKGEELFADKIFSSAGLPETLELAGAESGAARVGRMTFMESIALLDRKPDPRNFGATIVFYNDSGRYAYEGAKDFYDSRSAVVCCPDNYDMENREGPGCLRVTFMANYEKFKSLDRNAYLEKKEEAFEKGMAIAKKMFRTFDARIVFKDVFTPATVERYTWHKRGTVYGSPDKVKDGKTPVEGLYVIGTDQGFLGIVGSILSGISISNLYGLMNEV